MVLASRSDSVAQAPKPAGAKIKNRPVSCLTSRPPPFPLRFFSPRSSGLFASSAKPGHSPVRRSDS